MKRYCKLFTTLNKYKGTPCESAQDAEYTFEVETLETADGYHNGTYTLKSYHNGKPCDLEFNGWSFSGVSNGTYHFPGSYQDVRIEIDCYSPCGESVIIRDSTRDTWDFWTESAALYMNRVMLVCLFKDKNEYQSFEDLQQKYADCISSKESLRRILKELFGFKEVLKRNEDNSDIPPHFIENAKREYKRISSYLKGKADIEDIYTVLFEE